MKRGIPVLLALAVLVICPLYASGAVTFTQLGDWHKATLGGAGTVEIQSATGSGGVTYVNGIGAVAAGNKFVSIGSVPLATLQLSGGGSDGNPDGTADTTVLTFCLEGTVQSIDATTHLAIVKFNQGAYGIATPASYATNDPSQWGLLTGVGGVFVSPESLGVLKLPEDIHQGDPDARFVDVDASLVNQVSGNVVSNGLLSGVLLALQLDEQNPLVTLATQTIPPPFEGLDILDEVAIVFDQTAERIQRPTTTAYSIGAVQVTDLNTIFLGLFGAAGLVPSNAFGFASGFGGAAVTDYSPIDGNPAAGDFPTNLDTTVDVPALEAVPEPVSMVVWGALLLIGAVGFIRRRRR